MKPLSSCALFGAVRALGGIKDALILQHSVVGCQWGSLAFRYAGKPYDVRQASDVIYDEDVVNGGEKVLRKALQEAERIFAHCGAVFVVSGCVPNMIGDDVDGILATTEGSQKLLHVKAPGYAGDIDSGAEAAYLALLPLLRAAEKKQAATINILGIMNDDPYVDNDLLELKKFLGTKVKINCALQDCSLRNIAAMPQAELNICFGYGEPLAKKMQEEFGVPYIKCAYPYGVAGMQKFLRQLGEAMKIDFSNELAELEAAAEKLVYRCADYLVNLYQLPVALATDKAHLAGLHSFFAEELGMRVVIAEDTAEFSLDKMTEAAKQYKPVLLCGSSFLKNLADAQQVPLVRCVYPAFDRLCFTDNTLVGARGAALLIEQIVNGALQQQYKSDGRYAGLRESICEVNHE